MIRHILGLGVFVGVAVLGFYLGQHYTPAAISEYEFIQMVNARFADARHYDINGYNCVNYSQDYVTLMSMLGYNTTQVIGCNGTACHAWNTITLEIESITGEIRQNSAIYPLEYQKKK